MSENTATRSEAEYRPCVGIMLLNRHGEVFVGQRIDMADQAWQMPQGGIDEGEDLRSAALRELREEIGTDKAEILAESQGWSHYDLPAELTERARHLGRCGQRQKWFVMRFTGTDAGKDLDHLTPDDLAPVDEFHGGQRPATIRLGGLVGFTGTERVLDVGSGLGGPSRFLAWRYGCRVSGVDLTAEFVRVAEMLTRLTGLVDKVDYRQGDALNLPFADRSFDVVWSQNAAMNIADRDRLYSEMRRVLRPGGKLALQEVASGPSGPPHFPVQWAREPIISFLLSQEAARETLEATGLRVLVWQDTTEAALQSARRRVGGAEPPTGLGTHLILGPDWQAMTRNSVRNLEERRVALFNAVLQRID